MKVVFQGQLEWENKPHAEKELGRRMRDACLNLGLESLSTSNITEIENFNPDIVFPLHHFTPKLFDAYTIGCMWNPIKDVENSSSANLMHTFENIKSYDACAIASPNIERYLDNLFFKSPVFRSKYTIYPSANKSDFSPIKEFNKIAYVGSNWQGDRHKEIFLNTDKIGVYGPSKSWEYLKKQTSNYYGEVSFNKSSILNIYKKSGIGLCFHAENHLRENVPNMRIFEMAAAGVLIFADKLQFIKQEFGDSVIYIDTEKSSKEIIEQIDYYYNWALNNREKAVEMAEAANKIFNKKFTLEKLLNDIISQYKDEKRISSYKLKEKPSVEIIMRTDGKRSTINDAIKSVVEQTYKNVSLCLIYWGDDIKSFEKMIKKLIPSSFKYRVINQKLRKDRSYNFYTGIKSSQSDYLGFLDDDDAFFKNHIETLLRIFEQDIQASLVYSGIVKRETHKGYSKRDLSFFHDFFNFEGESFITSNSYLVKRKSIPPCVLQNSIPIVSTGEDRMFLDILFKKGLRFVFSEKVTSLFNKDNILFSNVSFKPEEWTKNIYLYEAFLRKSSLMMPYIKDSTHIESSTLNKQEKEISRKVVDFLKFLSQKTIPFKIRRFILLIVKDLVSSSSSI